MGIMDGEFREVSNSNICIRIGKQHSYQIGIEADALGIQSDVFRWAAVYA